MSKFLSKEMRGYQAVTLIKDKASQPVKIRESPKLESEMKEFWTLLMQNQNRNDDFYRYKI